MEESIVSVNTCEYGSVDDEEEVSEEEDPSEEEPFEEDPDEEEPNEVYPFEVEPNEEDPVEEELDEVDPYKVEPDEEDPEEEPSEEEPEEEPFEEEEEPMEDPEEEEEPMEDSEEEEEPMEDPERSSPQQCHDEETHQFNLAKMTTPPDTTSVSKRVSDKETLQFNSAKMTMPPDTTSVSKRVSDEETLKFNSAKMTMSSDTTSASKGVSDEESLHFNSTKMIVSSDTKHVSRRVYELPSIQNSSSNNVTAPEKPATTQVTGKKRRNKCGAKDEASGLAQDGCKLATKKLKTKSGANSKSHHVKAIDDSKLFVGFFPHFVDETKLIELFCAFGPISEVKMMRDVGTGSSKGYGYIKYTNYIDAAKAVVQMSGYKFAGRTLTVRIAGIFSSHPGPPVTLQSHPAQPSRLGHPESRPPESVASFPCSSSLKTSSNTSSGQYLAGPLSRSSTSNNPLFSGDFVSRNEVSQSPGTLKSNVPQSKKKKKKIKAKCFYCGKYGHLKLECWNYLADIGRGAI